VIGAAKTGDRAKNGGYEDDGGENQKLMTDGYRNNWNDIFGKKPRRRLRK
jgi:hypothetical protein